jgi:hypothetical protein
MDELHRYRAGAGIRAINELQPILGLELTAMPYTETACGTLAFKNVIYDYPLGRAMADGFVKEPAVVTRPTGAVPGLLQRSGGVGSPAPSSTTAWCWSMVTASTICSASSRPTTSSRSVRRTFTPLQQSRATVHCEA